MIKPIKIVVPPPPLFNPLTPTLEEEHYDIYLQCVCKHFVRISCPVCGSQPDTNTKYEIVQSECPECKLTTMIAHIAGSISSHKCKSCNSDTILHLDKKTVYIF